MTFSGGARVHLAALAGAAAAGISVLAAWGFSVDDALIAPRVAHHLWAGLGYRFNADGPVVDCVTPLGWAALLIPVADADIWQILARASTLGAGLWVVAGAGLGRALARSGQSWRSASLLFVLAASLPLGAWAVAGMETALVLACAVGALGGSAPSAASAGLAGALRPELAPWALTLALGQAIARRASWARRAAHAALAIVPALSVAALREHFFGHPAPLAVFAKPSDFEHGLSYAFGFLLLSGPPLLLIAARPWRGLAREHWALVIAAAVHLVVLVGVGGDWMPLWRLATPLLPSLLVVGAALAERSSGRAHTLRLLAAGACAALLHAAMGTDVRRVRADRQRMSAELVPLIAGAERIASVDVGWVAAATDRHVVDLAGVTDPEVAYLPGGHTSKRLPEDFLERRGVDALILLLAPDTKPGDTSPARAVERRVLTLRGAEQFVVAGDIALSERQRYAVLRRRPACRMEHDDGAAPDCP